MVPIHHVMAIKLIVIQESLLNAVLLPNQKNITISLVSVNLFITMSTPDTTYILHQIVDGFQLLKFHTTAYPL